MNYDQEMLKLYFKEKGYTKEQINELLDTNPFDERYAKWEKIKQNDNKTMSIILKRNYIIPENRILQEILVHPQNCVSKYLTDDSILKVCSSEESIKNVRVSRDLLLISGLFEDEEKFLHFLITKDYKFVACMCTREMDLYERYYNMLRRVSKRLRYDEVMEFEICNQNLCLLKNYK